MSYSDVGEPKQRTATSWGWGLCGMLFLSTVLNYMDRQTVSVVGARITEEFKIRFEDLGWIVAAFQLPYALFQVPAGFLADRWDVRRTYAIAVIWWSLAAIAVAWSPTLGTLMAFRAILGLGESFNWPCALKVTSTVLPPRDRGLGNGIFNSGAAVGAVLTPIVVAYLTVKVGWRWAFAFIGMMGLIWAAAWLILVYGPAQSLFDGHVRLRHASKPIPLTTRLAFAGLATLSILGGIVGFRSEATLRLRSPMEATTLIWDVAEGSTVHRGQVLARTDGPDSRVLAATDEGIVTSINRSAKVGELLIQLKFKPLGLSAIWLAIAFLMIGLLVIALAIPLDQLGNGWMGDLGSLVRLRRFWVLAVVSISINVCWHFLVNWLPTYLKTDRVMAFETSAYLSVLPFLAADVGNIGGGAIVRWLAQKGLSVSGARAWVLSVCVLLIAPGAFVGVVRSDGMVIGLLAIMALGTAAFMANYFAYCQDVSSQHTGLVVGILGGLGNLFAAGFAPIAGGIKDSSGSFGPVFLIVGLLPFVGLAFILLGWGQDDSSAEDMKSKLRA